MISSLRARLAAWHTAVLAVLLAAFAGGAYAFVVRSVRARTDASLSDALLDLRDGLLAERGPGVRTRAVAREVLSDVRFRAIVLAVFDDSARLIASAVPPTPRPTSEEDSEPPFDLRRVEALLRSSSPTRTVTLTLPDAEGGYRVELAPLAMNDGRFTIVAATSIHDDAEMLRSARAAILVAIPVALILAWMGGSLLARRSLAPMVTIRAATARISASTLGERVPTENPDDEVGQLAAVINGLLERLERSFAQQQQFMADASHELRTPVAVVQSEASRALSRRERSAAEYEDAMLVVHAAARRLRRIVDDLFLLARADAGEVPVRHDPLYLDELVEDCARQVRSIAEQRRVTVSVAVPSECPYEGDEALLHRLLVNLLDNAIKHSPDGATVRIRLARADDAYQIEVENGGGPPIPVELQSRIFDRFVRGDASRSRHDAETTEPATSGAGLGLSIARWIAAAHRGTLELAKSDETSTVFRVRLPLTQQQSLARSTGC